MRSGRFPFGILGTVPLVLFCYWALWAEVGSVFGRTIAAFLVLAVFPGALITWVFFRREASLDALEKLALGIGISYTFLLLGALFLHYLPGPLTQRMILLTSGVSFVLLLALAFGVGSDLKGQSSSLEKKQWVALAFFFLVAVILRFLYLGYSEFQGDEGRAMLRAAEVLQGNDQVLFLHKKGPVEILLPAILYGAVGYTTEAAARFPFALANVSALLALFVLGRRLFGSRVALLAVALMVIDGFWEGFARIVQYQSIVLLMTILAIFSAYRFYEEPEKPWYLLAVGLFSSVALLAHYEGFFAIPGAAYLIWKGLKKRWKGNIPWLVGTFVLMGVLVGAFYVPFVLHPHFIRTLTYLGKKRVGGGLLYNNFADFFNRASYYNAVYYPLLLSVSLAGAIGVSLWRKLASKWGRLVWTALVVAWGSIILFPSLWQIGGVNLSVSVFLLTIGLLFFFFPSVKKRLMVIWLGGTALLYFFLMLKVHTHYYVAMLPWSLIVAGALSKSWQWLGEHGKRGSWLQWIALLGGLGLWALCAGYIYLAFVQHDPEFRFHYRQVKPAIYWTPFGDYPPRGGYFGFPYHTAWKAVGVLFRDGVLKGTYDSNQEDLVTNWYTRGALRCPDSDIFIVARDVENPHALVPGVINGEYMPWIEIERAGQPQIYIFRRGYKGPLQKYAEGEETRAIFDEELSKPSFRVGPPLDEVFHPSHLVNARLGEFFELVGWDVDRKFVSAGGQVLLTLYWRTLEPSPANYHVFVHLGDGEPLAIADGVPRCGQHPTYRWQKGEQVVDRYLLTVSPEAKDGVYPLRVGMYDFATKERLRVVDVQGHALGNTLLLTKLRVGVPRFAVPSIAQRLDLNLGDRVRLLGYALEGQDAHPGGQVRVTLYWKCLAPMQTSYTVFVHLLGPDGQRYGQKDSLPWGGHLPTDFWLQNEVIVDSYLITIDPNAPKGEYHLAVGMYDVRTGQRLPMKDAQGQRLVNDRAILGPFKVNGSE
ncbi:MAG: glycosyltransferase family 39 protein [Anaerolineae bacterium]|nr:glycosyltransferase family 39 protein [Anaerolineae bacterium]